MLIKDFFDNSPFIKSGFSDGDFAQIAKVINLSCVRTACLTKIFKVDVHNEIGWNDLSFIFTDVFWAKLHLTSLDVVATLDESCVEHDAEHGLIRETSVTE